MFIYFLRYSLKIGTSKLYKMIEISKYRYLKFNIEFENLKFFNNFTLTECLLVDTITLCGHFAFKESKPHPVL